MWCLLHEEQYDLPSLLALIVYDAAFLMSDFLLRHTRPDAFIAYHFPSFLVPQAETNLPSRLAPFIHGVPDSSPAQEHLQQLWVALLGGVVETGPSQLWVLVPSWCTCFENSFDAAERFVSDSADKLVRKGEEIRRERDFFVFGSHGANARYVILKRLYTMSRVEREARQQCESNPHHS